MISVDFDEDLFNTAYMPYLNTVNPYELYYGGAGSGKSHFVAQKCLIKCMRNQYYRLVFCRKWAKHVRGSQWQLFKDLITEYKLGDLFELREGTMDIVCINGNKMLSFGLDDHEKVKSIQRPSDIWAEELTDFDKQDFDTLDMRLRASEGFTTQFIGSFNPVSEDHWIKTDLYDKRDELELMFLRTTYLDNRFIDRDAFEAKLNRQSLHNQKIYKFGEWGRVRTGMEYYPDFDDMKHTGKVPYDPKLALHITFDFNRRPYMTLLICQIVLVEKSYELRIVDEICLGHPRSKTKYVCEDFMKKYRTHQSGVFYYGDATAEKENTLTVGEIRHDYDVVVAELKGKLHNASNRTRRSNPPVLIRKDFITDMLRELVPIKLLIDSHCKHTIDDFMYLKEGPDGRKLKQKVEEPITEAKYEKYGHTSDALEYLACEAFKTIFAQYERRQAS